MRCASFEGARFTDTELVNTVFEGEVNGLVIRGVDVTEFVNAEPYKQHPFLKQLRGHTAADIHANFDAVYARWNDLNARATALGTTAAFARVDDEWSLGETLRHLIYATDAWFRHAVLDLAEPYRSIGLSHSQARGFDPGIDLEADPSLDEILAARAESQGEVRTFLAGLSDDDLDVVVEAKGHTVTQWVRSRSVSRYA